MKNNVFALLIGVGYIDTFESSCARLSSVTRINMAVLPMDLTFTEWVT